MKSKTLSLCSIALIGATACWFKLADDQPATPTPPSANAESGKLKVALGETLATHEATVSDLTSVSDVSAVSGLATVSNVATVSDVVVGDLALSQPSVAARNSDPLPEFKSKRLLASERLVLPSGEHAQARVYTTDSSIGKVLVVETIGEESVRYVYSAEHLIVGPANRSEEAVAAFEAAVQRSGMNAAQSGEYSSFKYVAISSDVPSQIFDTVNRVEDALGDVAYAELDSIAFMARTPNDPNFSQQYHHGKIGSTRAWDRTTGSSSVVIAVIDTGVNYNLDEFQGKTVAGYDYVNNDSDPMDDQGHGTFCAGIAAANTNNGRWGAGVDWNARIMPIKVLDSSGSGSTSNIARGVDFAVNNGAKVINLSLGGPSGTQTLENAINNAIQRGVIVVAAAGNGGARNVGFPGAYPQCITVGATDSNDNLASFSSYGPAVDLVAPGVGISTLNRNGSFSSGNGTSFSTPIVAGAAALLASLNSSLNQDAMVKLLTVGADDLGSAGYDERFGWGRLNIPDSIAELDGGNGGGGGGGGTSGNIAPSASISVSSEYSSAYSKAKLVDGIKGVHNSGEWASRGETRPWAQLNWNQAVTVNKVVLYDRANLNDTILAATLLFSDGSSVAVGSLPNNGAARTVEFASRSITWVRVRVDSGSGPNVGLSELEVFGSSGGDDGNTGSLAVLTSPAPGSTLSGTTVTFRWTSVAGADYYDLVLSNANGGRYGDLLPSSPRTTTAVTLAGLPTDGRQIQVTLWTLKNGNWDYNNYTVTCSRR